MQKKKAWIYARVSEPTQRNLIFYQRDLLCSLAEHMNLEVCGFVYETTKGSTLNTKGIRDILVHVRRKDFDVLLIYDWTRLTIYQDLFMEVKMFCDQYHVSIFTIQDIENRLLG